MDVTNKSREEIANLFQPGDKAVITDIDCRYTYYTKMANYMGLTNYEKGDGVKLSNGDILPVVAYLPHLSRENRYVLGVEKEGLHFLIEIDGVEKYEPSEETELVPEAYRKAETHPVGSVQWAYTQLNSGKRVKLFHKEVTLDYMEDLCYEDDGELNELNINSYTLSNNWSLIEEVKLIEVTKYVCQKGGQIQLLNEPGAGWDVIQEVKVMVNGKSKE